MPSPEPRSLLDRLVGICLSLLLGAVAVYAAVKLIESVVWALLIIAMVVGLIAAAVVLLRRFGRDW